MSVSSREARSAPHAITTTVAADTTTFDVLAWARTIAARTTGIERWLGAVAVLENARWVIEEEEAVRRLQEPERHVWRRVWKALVLARDVETWEALLEGERVPVDRLDPEGVARFGRRR